MIELKDISKSYNYNKSNETVALRSVNLKIDKGEMVAVVGPSGAGKSTLLHVIGALCTIQSGSYTFDGEDVSAMSENKRSRFRNEKIGIVMQNFALVEEYTVADNVAIPLYFRKGVKNRRQLVADAMQKTGIYELKNKYAYQLSGGEKQRCAISRCLCQNPQVILADEPTGQLDSANAANIMDIFEQLNNEGMTVIVVTHDENVANRCKRIVHIKDGQVLSDVVR